MTTNIKSLKMPLELRALKYLAGRTIASVEYTVCGNSMQTCDVLTFVFTNGDTVKLTADDIEASGEGTPR